MVMEEEELSRLIRSVLAQVIGQQADDNDGVFTGIQDAISAAKVSQKELGSLSIEKRKMIIEAMRSTVLVNVAAVSELALQETGMGRLTDKIAKNILAATKTPGVEDICPGAFTGDHGFTLIEHAPYGVIGAITPSTNPSETVICNSIGMIAGGNSVVFNPHPGAKKSTQFVIQLLNRAIISAGGPKNLITTVEQPTIQTGLALMEHADIRLLVVTGGPEIVKIAMRSGKKVIAAGPGNPPVVVDETAELANAAQAIVDGASFDNNVLCIAEKEIFAVESIADKLKKEMIHFGSYEINKQQLNRLMDVITLTKDNGNTRLINKQYIGKDAKFILSLIDIVVSDDIRLILAEVENNHSLVTLEQLMPIMPLVRCHDVSQAIDLAVIAEGGCFHTAIMHSRNIDNLSKMAKAVNTTIFVKNGPSYAGLGMTGEGFTTFTIASPTGEGLTSAITFTRQRRCVLKDQFRII